MIQDIVPGCVTCLGIGGFSIFGFLIYPDTGFLAPILMFITIFGTLYILNIYNHYLRAKRKGLYSMTSGGIAHIHKDYVVISEQNDMNTIYYNEITNLSDNISFYKINYSRKGQYLSEWVNFPNERDKSFFIYDLERALESYKRING